MGRFGSLSVLIRVFMGPHGSSKFLMGPCGPLLVLLRLYRFQWVLMGPFIAPTASLLLFIGSSAFLCVLIDSNLTLWDTKSPNASLWFFRISYVSLCVLMDSNGSLGVLIGAYSVLWILMYHYGSLYVFFVHMGPHCTL